MKRVKGSSVTIPTNCRAFITMENKKNKLGKGLLLIRWMLLKILVYVYFNLKQPQNCLSIPV